MRLVWVSLSDLKPGLQFRETRALGTGWGPLLRALGACPCQGGRAAVSGAEGWSWAGEKEKKRRDGGQDRRQGDTDRTWECGVGNGNGGDTKGSKAGKPDQKVLEAVGNTPTISHLSRELVLLPFFPFFGRLACGILVPQPGINWFPNSVPQLGSPTKSPALGAWSLNH